MIVINDRVISDKVISDKFPFITNHLSLITYLSILFFLFSCREPAPQVPANKLPESSLFEDLMLLNKEFAELENEEINHYIDSLNLGMAQTSIGLRYKIIREGDGNSFQKGDRVTLNYSIRTLDDRGMCEELQNITKTIELGKGDVKSGIEEAVMLLKSSGKGQFIIPSYLAYGVPGYKNCVPAWTPVFCEINIIESKLKR